MYLFQSGFQWEGVGTRKGGMRVNMVDVGEEGE
jgi:hypothetical protein